MRLHAGSKRDTGVFGADRFKYDAVRDWYLCPAGECLYPRSSDKIRMSVEYAVRKGTCDRCPLRPQCTSAKLGRTVQRRWGQELVDDGLAASSTKEAKRSRDRRKWRMEGSFAQSANLLGFKRSGWRRLWRQRIQDRIICAIENVKILISNGPKGTGGAAAQSRRLATLCDPLKRLETLKAKTMAAILKIVLSSDGRSRRVAKNTHPLFGQHALKS